MKFPHPAFARRAAIVILAAFAAALPQIVVAQDDPLVGKWILVPERSKYTPGPARYKSMTVTFSGSQRGLTKEVDGVDAEGNPVKGSFTAIEDGKNHPVTGISEYDSASWNRVSPTSTVYIYDKRRTTVVVGTRTRSSDGNTLTFSEKTVDDKGKTLSTSLMFFVKEGVDLASLAPPPGAARRPAPVAAAPAAPPSSTPDEDAGDAALAAGNDDEAIRLYTKAIEGDVKTPRIYYDYVSRAVAYLKKNQTAEAMSDFDEALKLKPDDLDARFRRAGLLVQEKKYEAAIDDFTKYLDGDSDGTDPNRAMALRLRGFSYNTLQQDVKAQEDYTAACMINDQLDVCPKPN
jgi:predicted negative regulator of RcsB-dependent stress response